MESDSGQLIVCRTPLTPVHEKKCLSNSKNTKEKRKGLGKSRGRCEKDCRNPGGGVIRDQNPGDGLRLKPFSRGI